MIQLRKLIGRLLGPTAQKTVFSFSKSFEKMVFPKNLHWTMIFLVLSGKMIFLFPKNMILFFRHKRKDDLSQKNTWKFDIFIKCSEKMVFPKNSHLNMIFFAISGKMIFIFSRKCTHGNMIFSVYTRRRYKIHLRVAYPASPKIWCPS